MVDYKDRLQLAMKRAPALAAVPERSRIQRVADVLGLSYQAVKKVLDGKSKTFSATNNARIADFLAVDPTWLATGHGLMPARAPLGPAGDVQMTVRESGPAPLSQAKLTDVFEDWRLHASPLSLEVIDGLSLLAQKNALGEADWQVIKALMLRFGKP